MADQNKGQQAARPFEITDITRYRTVGWGVTKAGDKPGAITTAHTTKDDGKTVDLDACKRFGIDPAVGASHLTVADLPKEYSVGAREALVKLASEWSEGAKDKDGKPIKWSPDDVMHYLVLQSRMQDAANVSIKQHRPVSDKALDRTVSTLVKAMKNNGKTITEVLAVLTATGATFTESGVRETYGA